MERSDHHRTIPLAWHMDGVKVYKTHKAYVYSFSSLIRKGPSLDTKCLTLLVRDGDLVKPHTHNDIGILIGYIMKVLSTGNFPTTNERGEPFKGGTLEASRAGQPFAGGWRCAFAAFKADLEARVVHQLTRNWASDSICEHCLASKNEEFSYGDFSDNAAYLECMFDHNQFLMLNPAPSPIYIDTSAGLGQRSELRCFLTKQILFFVWWFLFGFWNSFLGVWTSSSESPKNCK